MWMMTTRDVNVTVNVDMDALRAHRDPRPPAAACGLTLSPAAAGKNPDALEQEAPTRSA